MRESRDLRSANMAPIPILTYHQIAQAPARGAPFRSLYVSPRSFAWQMAGLKALGYQGLSMAALMPYLLGQKSGKVVGLTFDDGYENNLLHALPVLRRHGFSATCYGVSQLLGRSNEWDRDNAIAAAPLMTAAQLRQWVQAGQNIGAHTRHHVHLPGLDATKQTEEISGSRIELELALSAGTDLAQGPVTEVPKNWVGSESSVEHFCYPYGDYDELARDTVQAAGFHSATTTRRGRCQRGEDLLALPRVPVLRSTSLLVLWLKLATRYEDRRRA